MFIPLGFVKELNKKCEHLKTLKIFSTKMCECVVQLFKYQLKISGGLHGDILRQNDACICNP